MLRRRRHSKPIYSVAIAEFDIDKGNTLKIRHPDFNFNRYDHQTIANLSIPDGAHLHGQDHTFMVLHMEDEKGFSEIPLLFGVAVYHCVHDATQRRGARQNSIVLLSRLPYFPVFLPILHLTLTKYMENSSPSMIKLLYRALNENFNKTSVKLFGDIHPLNFPKVERDEIPGASVIELIRRFKTDTMVLWYAMLTNPRILIIGQPAADVCNCVISTPLLVSPLEGFREYLVPYVALTDTTPLDAPVYIAGSTNPVFARNESWADFLCSFESGSVIQRKLEKFKISGSARTLIKNIMSGIQDNRSEIWVRQQFREFTQVFLKNLSEGTLKGGPKKYLSDFNRSELFKNFEEQLKENAEVIKETGADHLEALKSDELDRIELGQELYSLHESLVNISTIESIVEKGGVNIISKYLDSTSAQVRKYAVGIIAQLALCVNGQLAVLNGTTLDRIIELLNDPRANVQSAASYCMMKISSLYIGVVTLVARNVHVKLVDSITRTEDLKMKCDGSQTLINIYKFLPDTPKVGVDALNAEFITRDPKYFSNLVYLFDLYKNPLPQEITTSTEMLEHIKGLNSDTSSTRVLATSYLFADLVAKPSRVYELVSHISTILENERMFPPDHKLSQLSLALLSLIADTFYGRKQIVTQNVIERVVNMIGTAREHALYIFQAARFLEVCSQYSETAPLILRSNGHNAMIIIVNDNINRPMHNIIVLPALGTLRYLLSYQPIEIPLERYFVHPKKRFVSQPSHDPEIQDLLEIVLTRAGCDVQILMERSMNDETINEQFTTYHKSKSPKSKSSKSLLFLEDGNESLLDGYTEEQLIPKMSEKRKNEITEFINLMNKPFPLTETGL